MADQNHAITPDDDRELLEAAAISFEPVFTKEQVAAQEAAYNTTWGVSRHLMLITLSRSREDLDVSRAMQNDWARSHQQRRSTAISGGVPRSCIESPQPSPIQCRLCEALNRATGLEDTQLAVQHEHTRREWKLPYAAIKIPDAGAIPAPSAPEPLPPTRVDFRRGDRVSFEERHLETRIGTIIRINLRTASPRLRRSKLACPLPAVAPPHYL